MLWSLSMSADRPACACCLDAGERLSSRTVRHSLLEVVLSALREAIQCHSLIFLVGPSGVGKDAVSRILVEECNRAVELAPRLLRAALICAPVPHRSAFSWKDLWLDVLRGLDDPLPDRKLDRQGLIERSGSGAVVLSTRTARSTEGALQRAVRDAAADRGLELLVINEAYNLIVSERGRTLLQQLDVLRQLGDESGFRIVLVSTGRVLASLSLSAELARRMGVVYFPRYGAPVTVRGTPVVSQSDAAGLETFSRVVRNFLDLLPESQRFTPSPQQLRWLYERSLGCVGVLADWFRRAFARCGGDGSGRLRWEHLEQTVVSDTLLQRMRHQCEEGERAVQRLCEPEPFQGTLDFMDGVASPPARKSGRSGRRRPGTPNPTRRSRALRSTGTQ